MTVWKLQLNSLAGFRTILRLYETLNLAKQDFTARYADTYMLNPNRAQTAWADYGDYSLIPNYFLNSTFNISTVEIESEQVVTES